LDRLVCSVRIVAGVDCEVSARGIFQWIVREMDFCLSVSNFGVDTEGSDVKVFPATLAPKDEHLTFFAGVTTFDVPNLLSPCLAGVGAKVIRMGWGFSPVLESSL